MQMFTQAIFWFVMAVACAGPAMGQSSVIIRPEPAPGPLDNPLKGWCPYTNAGEIHQPYSMVFQYGSWKQLEPSEGDFHFDEWEESWNVKQAEGRHIIFRIYIDYPSRPSGLPDWLRKKGVKETPYQSYGGGMSPDYNDPQMIAAMQRLIAALGKRYNNHPRIAFIQLGLLGYWGEWHTYPESAAYASKDTERKIIDAYRTAFPDKSLMVRYSRDYSGQQSWIGFHDDMFPADTDNGEAWSFLAGLRATGRTKNFRQAVVGGEMEPHKASQWMGAGFTTTSEMLRRAHFSWVGPYCPALEISKDTLSLKRSQSLVRAMGYEYRLTEVRHPESIAVGRPIRIHLKGSNDGVAPFYYPWRVQFALIDHNGKLADVEDTDWNIRSWQSGSFTEEATAEFSALPGRYQLAVGIQDPWKKRPAIRFANKLKVQNGWTIVSEITVKER